MLRPFGDTNLVTLALEKYSRSTENYNLYFAAHEPELLEIGKRYSVQIIERDKASAMGEDIKDVFNYLNQIEEDHVIFLNASHPFLTKATVEQAIKHFEFTSAHSLTSVVRAHTWFYRLNGTPINLEDPTNLSTKTTEPLLQVAHAFHIFDRVRFLKKHCYWEHKARDPILFEIPENEAVDIDTEFEFTLAEALYARSMLT